MAETSIDKYSAAEQGLGYLYQSRLALLQLLALPESTSVLLEKDDDLDFLNASGSKSLASLKHKADGDRLTDLSTDFWKSVRIWLARYKSDGRSASHLRFFLLTTATVSETSFLNGFLQSTPDISEDEGSLSQRAEEALGKSKSDLIHAIAIEFNELTPTEKQDFLARILIVDGSPRIEDIPEIIKDRHMRAIRREHRSAVFERIEGWWGDEVIKQLTGTRTDAIAGYEVSDRLSAFAEEYKLDNLPITFRDREPTGEIDTDSDPRTFVVQLREIGVSSSRIRNAILDYYRTPAALRVRSRSAQPTRRRSGADRRRRGRSEPVGQPRDIAAAKGAVAKARAAGGLADQPSGRPWQQRIPVEVGPRDGFRQVLALDVGLEVAPELPVHARHHPVEWVADRRPPGHFGAFRAARGEAGRVIPLVSCLRPGQRFPCLTRKRCRLGGARRGDDSFRLLEGEHIPAAWMFFAALTSRS